MDRNNKKPPQLPRSKRPLGGKRPMELIASVSRSSGLEKDGDALKDFKVQDEYRVFIQTKLDDFWTRYPRSMESVVESEDDARQRRNVQENILILFRKLREGLVSAKRTDAFALEVYETSLYLTIIFDSPRQSPSILFHLIPDLYVNCPGPHPRLLSAVLVSLLHFLISSYPSQSMFRQHLQSLPSYFLTPSSESYNWISSLAASLRRQNYVQIERITRPESWSHLCTLPNPISASDHELPTKALHLLMDSLRSKARDTAWLVVRSAYRELSCHSGSETRDWLARSLMLQSVGLKMGADEWLERKMQEGHVRPKDGVEGRWIVCKIR